VSPDFLSPPAGGRGTMVPSRLFFFLDDYGSSVIKRSCRLFNVLFPPPSPFLPQVLKEDVERRLRQSSQPPFCGASTMVPFWEKRALRAPQSFCPFFSDKHSPPIVRPVFWLSVRGERDFCRSVFFFFLTEGAWGKWFSFSFLVAVGS